MKSMKLTETFSAICNQVFRVGLRGSLRLTGIAALGLAFGASNASGQASVLTQHNDNARTGQNTLETILNTTNVNVNTFGKLFSMPTTGQVYAQPLYVPGVTINGVVHNVLIVATEDDIVYAFDADSPGAPLWTAILVDASHGGSAGESPLPEATTTGCTDTQPYIGVTSTPVIDPTPGVMTVYVEAKSVTTSATYIHRLHGLDLTTGEERPQGPVVISATVSGTGDGSSGGQLTFDAFHHLNRPGLLLLNGSIYIAYASHCDDSPYHGWLFAYNASTFAQQSVFVTTPNGGLGGFWGSGSGVAADESGNIFIASGNGDFDTTNVPATELSDTILKLETTNGVLSLLDYFTPSDQQCLTNEDKDLGSGGVMILPDQPGAYPHILVESGKEGMAYVVNRDQMTLNNNHYVSGGGSCTSSDPQIVEESSLGGGIFSLPAYWNNTVYFWPAGKGLESVPIVNGVPSFSQMVTNGSVLGWPSASPSISSNGTTAGTAIIWGINNAKYGSPGPGPAPAIVHAFDASNIMTELWNSTQATNSRDAADNAVKFTVPTVVNGKVYVGGNSSVTVYGLLQIPATLTSPTPNSKLSASSAAFAWTQGASVTAYELWLGTTGVGSSNLYNSGSVTTQSTNVTGLPTNGVTIYARLWSMIAGKWQSNDYTYTEAGTVSQAMLTSPSPGSTLSGSSAAFSWTAGTGPTQYELWLSTVGVGQSDLYNSGAITATTTGTITVPTNGVKIYTRLWSRINNAWQSTDYTYTESGTPTLASLTSPTPGGTLSGSNVTFTWSAGAGPISYQLWLGTTGVGSANIFDSGSLTTTSANVTSLPTNGVTLYARMWSRVSGSWQSADYTYTELGTPTLAALTSPAPGSTLSGANVTFSWSAGAGPTQYELWLGSTGPGSNNLYNSGATTATSVSPTGLPTTGALLYVRLWSYVSGGWRSVDYTVTQFGTASQAVLNSPAPGSVLSGSSVTFSWTTGSGPVAYELWLGSTGIGSSNLYNSGSITTTSTTAGGLPTDGSTIYARLWSRINNAWQSTDYKYTAQ